jgi:hypothetical protein
MAPLSASALLEVWERGRTLHPVDRALRLVAVACPEVPTNEIAAMSLGDRDARLLSLHEETFGNGLPGVADCPGCGERLEFDLSTANLRGNEPATGSGELQHAGRILRFRPLNSHDLASVVGASSADEARLLLARRCLLNGEDVELSDDLVEALAERLAEIDPQAEVLLDLSCPACGRVWQLALDIEAYLWREISAEALRLLREVHTLARAYGWREADILAMSATRRRAYVELVT